MPYLIAPPISKDLPGLWAEGSPYHSDVIYDICSTDPKMPPVHYERHVIKPHSVCHFDAPGHIIPGGETIDALIQENPKVFYGPAVVIRIPKPDFKSHFKLLQVLHHEIPLASLRSALKRIGVNEIPDKLLIGFEGASPDFYRDPTHALTLSLEAARWLTSSPSFNLLGTIWKSTDFQPGSRERPIHTEIFNHRAGILECLNLTSVPEGEHYLSAFPIPLVGATESPVLPVLFGRDEISWKPIRR